MRSLMLWSCLFLTLTACGGVQSPDVCSATNCFGCCDASGACQLGRTDQACGVAGAQCTSCSAGLSCGLLGSCGVVAPHGTGGGGGGGGNSSQPPDGGGPPVVTSPGSHCAGSTTECGTSCRDLTTDENNCGSCGHGCSAGLVCNRGSCQALPTDCTMTPCPGDFGCNPETRHCTSGCFSNSDCRGDAQCSSGVCRCPSFAQQCGAVCAYADNTDCSCDQGYEAHGGGCTDVDECARGTYTCTSGSVCKNTPGGYTCECPVGTIGSPGHCERDECATNNGGCGTHGNCQDYPGSPRYCSCDFGYVDDGTTCAPSCTAGYQECVDPSLGCYPGPNGDRCLPAGTAAAGASCSVASDCQRGLSCSINANSRSGVCTATCYSTCATGFSCLDSVCRPNSQTACNALAQDCSTTSLGCYLGQTGTTCAAAGHLAEGQTCAYINDCSPGFACSRTTDTDPYTCKPLCIPGGAPCTNGRACEALSQTVFACF